MPTTNDVLWFRSPANICVPKGEPKRPSPHKLLENIVILYFESRFHKQNSVIRPKIKHFAPPQIFRLATPLPAKWTGKAGHETKICEHWQGPLKRARVNNFNPLSGCNASKVTFYNTNRNRRLGLSPSAGIAIDFHMDYNSFLLLTTKWYSCWNDNLPV